MPIPLILAPFLAKLASSGLDLISSAILSKGKDVVEQELGVDIEQNLQTPEGIVALQTAQMHHEERLIELATASDAIDQQDRESARQREVHVLESDTDWFNRSIASVLALVTIIGGGCFLYFSTESDIKYGVIALMSSVMTYYFGSSKTSAQKDNAISNLSRRK